jgi:hypothetical protein
METHTESQTLNLYRFQQVTMPVLLGWSVGSMITGWSLWWREGSRFLDGLGAQFVGWGLIDGIIAIFALRGAGRDARRYAAGEISPEEHDRAKARFKRIVALNAALDIGYVAGGKALLRDSQDQPGRRGTGWGVIVQGAFLFVWDILLLLALRVMESPREA